MKNNGVLLLFVLCLFSKNCFSKTTCDGLRCVAEVDFQQFYQSVYSPQYQSQWCWAATISMLFEYYGHPVTQDRIVSEVYGSPINMPALYGGTISSQLNRNWKDDNDQEFHSRIDGVYDYDAGISTLTNQDIIRSLDAGHPLIIGAGSHAMVLTAIEYIDSNFGPEVIGGGVFDPWPGIGARPLQLQEIYTIANGGTLRYLASATVSDEPSEENDDSAGGIGFLFILVLFSRVLMQMTFTKNLWSVREAKKEKW